LASHAGDAAHGRRAIRWKRANVKRGLCSVCGSFAVGRLSLCPSCGSGAFLGVAADAIISLPSGVPCPFCSIDTCPLVFRAWVRHTGYIVGSREVRRAAYLCPKCANRQIAGALVWTGVLGWWSVRSVLFRAPLATFYNWVGAFRAPLRPLAWGAIPVAEFLRDIRARHDEYEHAATRLGGLSDSPFSQLNEAQASVVFTAVGLYETLQVSPNSPLGDLRRAYTARAKTVHPDLQPESSHANDEMIRLNQAWEILRDEQMRAAYDWLEANRAHMR
jgi:hypothetical protein